MSLKSSDGSPVPAINQPHLAGDRVRFVGQPLAFVVAETRAAAQDAAEAIIVDIEERPAVIDPDTAQSGEQIHDDLPRNRLYHWDVGDRAAADAAFAAADHVVSVRVVNQRIVVNSLEPRGILVRYDAQDERWEAWCGNQGVHAARGHLASDLGVAPERIRVHAPDIGGAFGMKLMNHPEYALAALAAQDLGRPVKWVGSRSESFLSDVQGRDLRSDAEGAFDREGKLLGLRWRSVSNLGAFVSSAGAAVHTIFSAPLIGGVYDVRNVYHEVTGVMTNTTPTDAYRGAGRPEVIHTMERLMSAAARQIGLSQAEIRSRNFIRPEQLPYTSVGGLTFDALEAPEVLELAMEAADLSGFEARREASRARGAIRGLGLAYYFERTGGGPVENAFIRMQPDGTVEAAVGTQSTGQGHETVWTQIICEKLGIPIDRIRILPGDSDLLPAGGGTGGSRSAIQASRVYLAASDDVIAQATEQAAEMLEVATADLEFDRDAGRISVVGTDRSVALGDVVREAGGITGWGNVNSTISTTPNGCHIAEVDIDPETGAVTLDRYSIVDDFGTVINPLVVAGQVHGGVVQGVGQVLMEQMIWDRDSGQPLTGSFMDYAMPRADDVPSFSLSLHPAPTPSNPLGLKGCGEAGSVAGIPATANAVMDALASAGVDSIEPPFTPVRVWEALRRAG